MSDFRPPRLNKAILGICKLALPLELLRAQIKVQVVGDGLKRFHELDGKRMLIVCNHSNQYDPEVIMTFSKLVGEDFHFLCAREVFDWVFGSVGWWFQNMGVYSVMRGASDVESFKMTRDIIADGCHRLVIYPEGEVSRQQDFLLPLRSGSARLALQGQQEVVARGGDDPVYILPVGIRWRYQRDISGWLDVIMRLIEWRLGLKAGRRRLSERVNAAADAMLSVLEKEYFCQNHSGLSFEARVIKLREEILRRIGELVGVEKPPTGSHLVWLRHVHNTIYDFVHDRTPRLSSYERRLHDAQARKLEAFIADCSLVQQLIGVAEHERRPLTQERLATLISRIERQVLGFVLPKGPRLALVGVGEPFSLLPYLPEFEKDEHRALEKVTAQMANRLQTIVDWLDEVPQPLGEPPQKIKSGGKLPIEVG